VLIVSYEEQSDHFWRKFGSWSSGSKVLFFMMPGSQSSHHPVLCHQLQISRSLVALTYLNIKSCCVTDVEC